MDTKFYQASTSELYGKAQEIPQKESTPFYPRSPYAAAKLYSFWTVKNYREAYNLFASNGILFNHESERRGKTFVTRKISVAASKIILGLQDVLYLGNLDAKRDWGYAPEFVEGMWRILQHEKADDFVLATGETHSIREFVEASFAYFGLSIDWVGKGEEEVGKISLSHSIDSLDLQDDLKQTLSNLHSSRAGEVVVAIDERYFRPTEVDLLIGDPSKAKNELGWEPTTTFNQLVKIMVAADVKKIRSRMS